MMDLIAAVVMLALAVWLIKGAPVRKRKTPTDEQTLVTRNSKDIAKALDAANKTPVKYKPKTFDEWSAQ